MAKTLDFPCCSASQTNVLEAGKSVLASVRVRD